MGDPQLLAVVAPTTSPAREPASRPSGTSTRVLSDGVAAGRDLHLLGGFRLGVDGRQVGLARGEQRLVALLALRDGHRPRRQLAATLWPDRDASQATGCLRTSLWRLRREVDVVDERRDDALALSGAVRVDVRRLVLAARRGTARPDTWSSDRADQVVPATGDRVGELLPDWDEEWVLPERERLRQLSLHVLEARVRELAEAGRFLEACDLAHAAIAMEELRESSHRALIAVHLAEGNHVEALRHARGYRRRLRHELGLDPSPLFDELLWAVG